MAINFGTNKERRELEALLVTHHRLDVIIQLMTLSHEYKAEISDRLLSGQITMDTTADVTRSASLEFLDPHHRLHLDDKAPEDGSLYFNKMLKVTYVVSTPDLSSNYFVPVFTGPITKVDRSGPVISVECQGKEVLAFSTIWSARTYKKGLKKLEIIVDIMQKAGEVKGKMRFLDRDTKIGSNMSANRKHTFWQLALKLAKGMNLQLFYDGRGVLRMRKIPSKTTYVFSDRGALMSDPQVSYDAQEVKNAVEVIGGKPKKAKNKVHLRLVAPKRHPLSPWNIGRNGTARYLPIIIEDDSIKSMKKAREVAKKQLQGALDESIEVTFDSLPIPFLEELDLCRFHTETSAGRFRLQKMTIPLTADGNSSIGYLKRVTPKRRVNRNHKRRVK